MSKKNGTGKTGMWPFFQFPHLGNYVLKLNMLPILFTVYILRVWK